MPTHSDEVLITPHIVVSDAQKATQFYVEAFGARPSHEPIIDPTGRVAYAEILIGSGRLSLKDEDAEDDGDLGPLRRGGSSVLFSLQVPDVDTVFERALQAGATTVFPVGDRFYGYRDGRLRDPFGHLWIIQTAIS